MVPPQAFLQWVQLTYITGLFAYSPVLAASRPPVRSTEVSIMGYYLNNRHIPTSYNRPVHDCPILSYEPYHDVFILTVLGRQNPLYKVQLPDDASIPLLVVWHSNSESMQF